MTEKGTDQIQKQAIIRGDRIDLIAILSRHGLTGEYIVEPENGILAYFSQGPTVLQEIRLAAGKDPSDNPQWDKLTHKQQRTLLETVAGSVPWAMDQDVLSEGIDEALSRDPELSKILGWGPESE